MKKLLVALVMFAGAFAAFAELRISEICPRPNGMDPNGRQSGWIELYNDGSEAVDLADYEIVRANRGKALMPVGRPLASRTLAAKAYTVVYTSDEYDNADSGEVKIYANDMMVYPKKVSPKKFPFVALYKGTTLIDRFVVPVDLPDNQSVAPAGGAFTEYKGNNGGTGLADKWYITDRSKVARVILPVVTKGAANNRLRETAYGPNVGPLYGLAHDFTDLNPTPPAKPGKHYTVTLAINPAADAVNAADAEIASVKLITRTWSIPSSGEDKDRQKTPTQTTGEYVMTKSSSSAGQGQLWTATIPAADLPAAGQLVQWATIITEASGNSYRSPSYRNVKDGYQWYGTIVEPTSAQLSQTLQTWHVFGDANAVSYMDFGNEDYARFGIYDSQTSTYYDNVYLSGRGNSSKNYSKKSHSLKFSKVHPMRCTNSITGEEFECRKTSLLAEYCDMSRVRSSLSMMVRREAGQDVPFGYPLRTQLNGLFYQLAHHSNRFTDELLTDYYGYDKYGVAFKNVGNAAGESSGGSGNNGQQILPEDGTDQLPCYTTFKAGIKGAGNYTYSATGLSESDSNDVNQAVVKMFDLPHWLNYLALARLTQECDDGWSNLCLYYDRNGNGAWRPLAYDLHQSFGVYYYADAYGGKREIWADDDTMKCHPFYGGCHVVSKKKSGAPSYGNRAYEAVYQNAKYRRLHNRRLRTLMDTILMPPGTSRENTPFWRKYVQPMVDAQKAEDLLDRERWGAPVPTDAKSMIYCWDKALTFAEGVEDLWDNYIVKRRNHFYNTHSITNTSFEGGYAWNKNAQIPLAQSPISALKAKFSATPVPGGVVIRNLNEETVDMSGWKLAGALNFAFPAGTVIDRAFGSTPGEIFVVTDRINYIAGLEQSGTALTDQVILGNAANGTKTGCGLWTADGVEVVAGPAPEEPEPDKPEKTVFSGVYDEPVEITADASYVFSNATLNAGLVIADGVTAKLNSATNTVNKISAISAANAEVRFTGDGTMKLEGADTLATVKNLLVKSGTLQVKSTGVSATKKPVINVLGFVEQTGGVIDMNLDVATTNQIYGIYVANKNEKDAEGNDTVYALFDGGRFNAVVGAGKSAALYVNKGSAVTTFKGGEILDITLKGTEPRFANVAGKLEFKRVEVTAGMPEACGSVTGARVFKSDKSIVFSDSEAHFDVNVPGPDAEIFSAADRITVDAGVFELVASDDCFSATTNITVNGGLVYAISTENDVFDSNGDMELNGGTILAYTTAGGHEAFDVDPELVGDNDLRHQLRVNGGTIFATGGKNSAWPEDFVTPDGFVLYSAEDLAASDVSGKYASLKSTIDMITTAKLPVFTDTKCALLMTCPNMTGEPTYSASAPSAGSQEFHDLYIEMKGETNQSALRFLEIFGSTDQGSVEAGTFGDVGEYIVLTNPTEKVIQLAGVTVSIAKNDVKKGKIDDPKCLITLGVGELPAYGSIRLDQADYSGSGWSKITNGNIFLKLTDAVGNVVQSGYASFDNAKYTDVDGKGASLIAIYFGTSLEDTDACWISSAPPSQEDDPSHTDPDPSEDGHEGVQLWANGPYWATVNCGATDPTEAGYYYFGGEDTVGYMVKDGALKGDLVQVTSADDTWGDGWRKPTTAEATAMKNNCRIVSTGTSASGQPYVVIGGTAAGYTDKTITIPLAGYGNGKHVNDTNRWGTYGKYWTSDLGSAYRLCFTSTAIELGTGGYGTEHGNYYTIRLVSDTKPSGGGTSHTHVWGTPSYAWTEASGGYTCKGTVTCTEDPSHTKTATATVTYAVVTAATTAAAGTGRYTATFADTVFATQTKDVEIPKLHEHSYNGTPTYVWSRDYSTCTASISCDKSGCTEKLTETVTAAKNVTKEPTIEETGTCIYTATFTNPKFSQQSETVTLPKLHSGPDDNGYEYVQLWKDGPYWAKMNIGATSETAVGTYFSWGSTTAFDGHTCETANKSVDHLAAYLDADGNLKSDYDAASVKMGGDWRMPTKAEMDDLIANCTVSWDSSLKGTWVNGKGDYSSVKIFLPNAGYHQNGGGIGNVGTYGFYLSSTPNNNTTQAKAFLLQSANPLSVSACNRNNGYVIRGVMSYVPGANPGTDTHIHSWGTPTYSWSADGKSCTATRACTDTTCGETETETVTATFVTTQVATTEATGLGHYEASFKNSAFAKQSGTDVTIPKKEQQDDPPAPTGDYYVSTTGSDSNDGTSAATAFATIAKAVETAAAGSKVSVLEGTYELSAEISVAKAISIIGAGRDKTIVKAASGKNIRLFTLDAGAKIEGVTLTGGRVGPGAAALVKNGSISWCLITDNISSVHSAHGGAISFTSGQGTIDHCIISGNKTTGQGAYGAGIGGDGPTGAITVDSCLIINNKITGNGSGGGIGIKNSNYDLVVRNCTIMGNTGTLYVGGINREGGSGTMTLVNTIVCGNAYGAGGAATSAGNIKGGINATASKNCFFDTQAEANQVTGSLYGSPALDDGYCPSATSPVVGKGVTYSGIGKDLNNRSFASSPAIGCYEYDNGEPPTETVDWDHPEVTITTGVTAGTAWSALKNSVLDAADAAKLQAWAKNVGKVAFESAGDIKLEAFLLNCENTDAAIATAKDEFKFTSFDPEKLPTASDFADKGYNGVVTIEGRSALDSGDWATAKTGDHFFRAILSL